MITDNDKITTIQTIALVTTTTIGIGILSLPRDVALIANSDGWLLVIIGGILTLVGSFFTAKLIKNHPQKTIIEISEQNWGKAFSYIVGLLFIIFFTLMSAMVTRTFADVLNAFMLQKTPKEFIIITQMLLVVYLIRHGIEPIGRIAEIMLPILIIPIFILYLIALPEADFTELLPFLQTPFKNLVTGCIITMYSFLGFEVLLMMGPFIQKPQRLPKIMFISILTVLLLYLYITIIVFASMGVEDTKVLLWPGMSIIRTIMAPGGIFERLDAAVMALWTIASFTTISGYYFAAALAFSKITKAKEFKPFVMTLFPWIYITSTLPQNVLQTFSVSNILGFMGLILGIILPILLLGTKPVKLISMLLILTLLTATGCWDLMEIDKRLFVGTVGIDKAEVTGKYLVHFSAPVVRQIAGGEGGGGGDDKIKPVMLISTVAETISDAARAVALRLNRDLFFEHTRAVIISEEVAREGLKPIVNVFMRQTEFNRRSRIIIAQGTAEKVLEVEPWVEKLKAAYIDLLYRTNLTGKFFSGDFGDFMHNSHMTDGTVILSKIAANDKEVDIGGSAVIKHYHFVGWLSEEETQGANFFLGNIKGGDLVVESGKGKVTVFVNKAHRKLQLTSADNIPSYLLQIHMEAKISETQEGVNLTQKDIAEIEKLASKKVKSQIQKCINKLQNQYQADILKIGVYTYKFHPKLWNEYKDNWNEIFPKTPITIEVNTCIKDIGISQ